jgi:hypothetical protein
MAMSEAAKAAVARAVETLVRAAETCPAEVPMLLPSTRAAVLRARDPGRKNLLEQQGMFLLHDLLPPVDFADGRGKYVWTFRGVLPHAVVVTLAVCRLREKLQVQLSTGKVAELFRHPYDCPKGAVAAFVDFLGKDTCAALLPYWTMMQSEGRPFYVLEDIAARVSFVGAAQAALVSALWDKNATAASARAALLAAAAVIPSGLQLFNPGWVVWRRLSLWRLTVRMFAVRKPAVHWVMMTACAPPTALFQEWEQRCDTCDILYLAGVEVDAVPPTYTGAAMVVFGPGSGTPPSFKAFFKDLGRCRTQRWSSARGAWATL